jgi:hypothetical protein
MSKLIASTKNMDFSNVSVYENPSEVLVTALFNQRKRATVIKTNRMYVYVPSQEYKEYVRKFKK